MIGEGNFLSMAWKARMTFAAPFRRGLSMAMRVNRGRRGGGCDPRMKEAAQERRNV